MPAFACWLCKAREVLVSAAIAPADTRSEYLQKKKRLNHYTEQLDSSGLRVVEMLLHFCIDGQSYEVYNRVVRDNCYGYWTLLRWYIWLPLCFRSRTSKLLMAKSNSVIVGGFCGA